MTSSSNFPIFPYMPEKQKPMHSDHKLQRPIRLYRKLSSYCSVVSGVPRVDCLVAVSPFRHRGLEKEGGKPCAREECAMANQGVDPDFGEMLT